MNTSWGERAGDGNSSLRSLASITWPMVGVKGSWGGNMKGWEGRVGGHRCAVIPLLTLGLKSFSTHASNRFHRHQNHLSTLCPPFPSRVARPGAELSLAFPTQSRTIRRSSRLPSRLIRDDKRYVRRDTRSRRDEIQWIAFDINCCCWIFMGVFF